MRWKDSIFALAVACFACSAPPGSAVIVTPNDTLRADGLPAEMECGALVDGRRLSGAQMVDEVFVDNAPIVELGDVRTRTKKESVLLFAPGFQPGFAHPVWTAGSEQIPVEMEKDLRIRVQLWIVHKRLFAKLKAWWCLVTANRIYLRERMGIRLSRFRIRFVSVPASVPIPSDYDCTHVEMKPGGGFGDKDIRKLAYNRNALNVYFVSSVRGSPRGGEWCENKSPRTILLGTRCAPQLLAHEIGHALDLHHPDKEEDEVLVWRPGFDDRNVMASESGWRRRYFSEGQIFRAHFSRFSYLNRPGWLLPGSAKLRTRTDLGIKIWDAGTATGFGDYPPACWRCWDDGAQPASSGSAATLHCPHDEHPGPSVIVDPDTTATPPIPPVPPIPAAERYVRFSCPVGSQRDHDRDLIATGARHVTAFVSIAQHGMPAPRRARDEAEARATFRANQQWLALPIAARTIPAPILRELRATTEAAYLAQATADIVIADRIRALRAIRILRAVGTLPQIRPIMQDPVRDVAEAATRTVRALGG